jgi:hypothetical protein
MANDRIPLPTGLLTFCCGCHRLKVTDLEFVVVPESVRAQHESNASHGICVDCAERLYDIPRARYCAALKKHAEEAAVA